MSATTTVARDGSSDSWAAISGSCPPASTICRNASWISLALAMVAAWRFTMSENTRLRMSSKATSSGISTIGNASRSAASRTWRGSRRRDEPSFTPNAAIPRAANLVTSSTSSAGSWGNG